MFNLLICLDAGHGMNTSGKRCMKAIDPNETREWWLNQRIASYIQQELKNYDVDIMRMDDITGKIDIPLSTRVNKANASGARAFVSIHANAGIKGGSGGGLVAFVAPGCRQESKKLQECIYNNVLKETNLKGNRSSPLASANYYVLRKTNMTATLIEYGFMDSKIDTPIILTDSFARKAAKGTAKALIEFYGLHLLKNNAPELISVFNPNQCCIELVDKEKDKCGENYINLNYFGIYKEKEELFTLPAGHLKADYMAEGYWTRFYCEAQGKFYQNKLVYDASKITSNKNFYNKFITSLIIKGNNAYIEEINNVPEDADYVASGIPVIREGKPVTMQQIISQGWDSSPFRPTYHILIGLKKEDNKIYIIGWESKTNNLITSQEGYKLFKSLGFNNLIKFDGGGSFYYNINHKFKTTGGHRKINAIMKIKDSSPQEKIDIETQQNVSSYAKSAWEKAVSKKIIDGTRPKDSLTREDSMVILDALNLLN